MSNRKKFTFDFKYALNFLLTLMLDLINKTIHESGAVLK